MKKLILAISSILVTSSALGAMTIELYNEASNKKEGKQLVEMYIYGLGDGFFWANAAAKATNNKDLYCPPPNLIMNGKNYMDILNQEIEKGLYTKDTEVGLVLFLGLKNTFPCD
jgi:hypothetical protein